MGSSRLPNKVLLELAGKTVLEHVIQRTLQSKFVNEVIVATTISKLDLQLVQYCSSKNIRVFIGSEDNVLDRFYQAAKLLQPKNIIRITSDCPMIDPDVIDHIGNIHIRESTDYTSNTLDETFPDGLDAEVFTFEALKTAWQDATLLSEREHVTPYIKKNPEKFKLFSVKSDINLSHHRWTIDQQQDYTFLSSVFSRLYNNNPDFRMKDVLNLLVEEPGLSKINDNIIRNEGYLKSLQKD